MWSWKTWKCTDLLFIMIVQHDCGPERLGMSQIYCSSIVIQLWLVLWWLLLIVMNVDGSCNGCFHSWGGNDEKWRVMHWLTCGLGRGSPASDSLTLSMWSSAVTSADAGPNPLHDRVDSGCSLSGPLWCTRWWTPIPGSEGWSGQVFNCTGTSRTRDVCSKCAGMSMKLNDEWWDSC